MPGVQNQLWLPQSTQKDYDILINQLWCSYCVTVTSMSNKSTQQFMYYVSRAVRISRLIDWKIESSFQANMSKHFSAPTF